ncbi:MAG: transposase, partial [Microcystis sp. M144S2]|nr:transposase [Microcystis sp. M034S2]MCA2749702.1 transposase [Microcystis sp. M144S2]
INPGKRIIIFWDVASYHRGELIQGFLAEVNEGLAPENWKITCHLFAHYAPEENPIEAIWLSLKTLVRRCYRFCKNFRNPTGDNYTSAHRLSPIQSY